MRKIFSVIFLLALFATNRSEAVVKGRGELAPFYTHVKVVQSGKTNQRIDMYGGRFDATVVPIEGIGLCFKPFTFHAWGNGSDLHSYGLGMGHYTPVHDRLTLIPLVGVSRSALNTDLDVPLLMLYNLDQKFRSYSFYLGGEAIVKINSCIYLTGVYQYAWARTRTHIGTPAGFEMLVPPFTKGESKGSSYAVVLDYYIRQCVSASVAFGYNNSLSKERHGLNAYGIKVGLAYLF